MFQEKGNKAARGVCAVCRGGPKGLSHSEGAKLEKRKGSAHGGHYIPHGETQSSFSE